MIERPLRGGFLDRAEPVFRRHGCGELQAVRAGEQENRIDIEQTRHFAAQSLAKLGPRADAGQGARKAGKRRILARALA